MKLSTYLSIYRCICRVRARGLSLSLSICRPLSTSLPTLHTCSYHLEAYTSDMGFRECRHDVPDSSSCDSSLDSQRFSQGYPGSVKVGVTLRSNSRAFVGKAQRAAPLAPLPDHRLRTPPAAFALTLRHPDVAAWRKAQRAISTGEAAVVQRIIPNSSQVPNVGT